MKIRSRPSQTTEDTKYHFVQAAPFCKHYQIRPTRTHFFTNIDLDKEGTLLLELNTAMTRKPVKEWQTKSEL